MSSGRSENKQDDQDIEDSFDDLERSLPPSILGKHAREDGDEEDGENDDGYDVGFSHWLKRPRIDSDLDLERPSTDVLSAIESPHDTSSTGSPSADLLSLTGESKDSHFAGGLLMPDSDTSATDSPFAFFANLGNLNPSSVTPIAAPALPPSQEAMHAVPTVGTTSAPMASTLSSSPAEPKPGDQKTLEIDKRIYPCKYLREEGWVVPYQSLCIGLGLDSRQIPRLKLDVFRNSLSQTKFTIKSSRREEIRSQFYLNQNQICQMFEVLGNGHSTLQKTIGRILDSFEQNTIISPELRKKIKFLATPKEGVEQHVILVNIQSTKSENVLHFARLGATDWFISFFDICQLFKVPRLSTDRASSDLWLNKLGINASKLRFSCFLKECHSRHVSQRSLDANQTVTVLDRLQKDYQLPAEIIMKFQEALVVGTEGNYRWSEAITGKKTSIEIGAAKSEGSASDADPMQMDSSASSSHSSASSSDAGNGSEGASSEPLHMPPPYPARLQDDDAEMASAGMTTSATPTNAVPTAAMASPSMTSSIPVSLAKPKPEEQKALEIGKGIYHFKYLMEEGWVLQYASLYKSLGVDDLQASKLKKTVFPKPFRQTKFKIQYENREQTKLQSYLNQKEIFQMLEIFGSYDKSLQETIKTVLDSFEKNTVISPGVSRKKMKFLANVQEKKDTDKYELLVKIEAPKFQNVLHFSRLGETGWLVSFVDICKLFCVPLLNLDSGMRRSWLLKNIGTSSTKNRQLLDANQTATALDCLQKDFKLPADIIMKLKGALLVGTEGNYQWSEVITGKKPSIEIGVAKSEVSASAAGSSSDGASREHLHMHLASPAVPSVFAPLQQHSPQQAERKFQATASVPVHPSPVPRPFPSFFPGINAVSTPTPMPVPGMASFPMSPQFFRLPLDLMKARNPVGKSLPDGDVEMAPAGAPVPAMARTSN